MKQQRNIHKHIRTTTRKVRENVVFFVFRLLHSEKLS